jgi:hypothetical protein
MEAVMNQCTAKSKQSGVRCRKPPTPGHGVCHMHGSKTPRGFGLPQTKTGKYSKVLPLRLSARYNEALTNQDLLSLREDIAVTEARLTDLLSRVDSGESGQTWEALQRAADAFELALQAGDTLVIERCWATMQELVRKGSADYAARAEVYKVWETRCKLI